MIEDQKQISGSNNVGAIRAGDRSAFTTALQGELDALYRFVSRELRYYEALGNIYPGEVLPEEIVDEVAIQALRQSHRIPQRITFKGWLRQLALHTIHHTVRRLRQEHRVEAISLEDPVLTGNRWGVWYQLDAALTWEDVIPGPDPNPEEVLELKETEENLERALNALPPDQRLVFILRAIEGLSYAEIAGILHRPLGAIKETYHTAREALHQHFAVRFSQEDTTLSSQEGSPAGTASSGDEER